MTYKAYVFQYVFNNERNQFTHHCPRNKSALADVLKMQVP